MLIPDASILNTFTQEELDRMVREAMIESGLDKLPSEWEGLRPDELGFKPFGLSM